MLNLLHQHPAGDVVEITPSDVSTTSLFTITGGPVAITDIIGEVLTVVQTQANNIKLQAGIDLCAVVDVTGAAVGSSLLISGAVADAMVISADFAGVAQVTETISGAGTVDLNCSATNTGVIRWICRWYPMVQGAMLRPAA